MFRAITPWVLRRRASCVAVTAVLAGCAGVPAAPPVTATVQLQTAWFEGRVVRYITTDVSDAAVAADKGANFSPRLKLLVTGAPGAPLERVYSFVDKSQPTVFPSVPLPLGAGSKSPGYTPLWRMVQVRWKDVAKRRELRSEEAILQAEDDGDVSLVTTDVVLNCPVLSVDGAGVVPMAALTRR